MHPLFALPIFSLLIAPVWAFCGTSVNLIFFYMTWATLVLSHSALRVELVGTATVRLLCYALPSLLFFLFDILTPSAAVLLKTQGEYGLPAGNKRGKIRRKDLKVAVWALFNLVLGVAVQGAIEHTLTSRFRKVSLVRVTLKLPLPWSLVLEIFWGLILREVRIPAVFSGLVLSILSYIIHRWVLHTKNPLARLHAAWYHALRAPYPLTAHYDHPLAYLIGRWLPTILPVALWRLHMVSYLVYLAIVSLEETFAYSGYSPMPTGFFIGGMARNTEAHLHSLGTGNFGPWGILDRVMGTAVDDKFAGVLMEDLPAYVVDDHHEDGNLVALGGGDDDDDEGVVGVGMEPPAPQLRRVKNYWAGEPKIRRTTRGARRRGRGEGES
ncbi:sterol desaturase family [Aspergillus violaceofuscus CBS 115571]|uniref:Sterol desaturase family n=1 Tax=Aspergillus violaceofuscus (strain CBS 115571) TaxID=1450538 RepID=A0A2V5HDG7_ASPV1|nr:sterol desaturase family [Aspergillus violaceofuscus CBS 115571]